MEMELELGVIEEMVREGMAVNLVGAACLTALIYDHALTLGEEIGSMWRARLSIAKGLFFINRYVVEGMLLFNCISASQTYRSKKLFVSFYLFDGYSERMRSCTFFMRWLSVVAILSTIVVQGILVLRVWALHRSNKWSLRIAFFFYFGGSAALIGLLLQDYFGENVALNTSLASLPGCYATSVPSIIAGQWIAPLIVETVLFVLVISRAYFWWKEGMAMPRIFSILARDSTLYFTIIFAFLLGNYLLFELGPPFLSSLLVTPSTTAGCILGSHMLLNLRSIIEPSAIDPGESVSQARFTIPVNISGMGVNSNNTVNGTVIDIDWGRSAGGTRPGLGRSHDRSVSAPSAVSGKGRMGRGRGRRFTDSQLFCDTVFDGREDTRPRH